MQNYHRHSFYSNVLVPDVVVSNEDFAIRAKELGDGILSGVEHGWQGRYIEGYTLAKKYGLKFLFGTEAYIVKDRIEKDATNAHIILLAKNENGRVHINRILSEANLTGFYYRPRIDFSLLYTLPKDDVWITTACVGGIWKYDDSSNIVKSLHNYFKNNFFLEVQYHNVIGQQRLNQKIINLSNENNIQIIMGCDSHYISSDQSRDRDDYLLSKHVVYEDEDGWYMDYPSEEVAINRFKEQRVLTNSQIKEAIENTNVFLEVEEYTGDVFKKNSKIPSIYKDKTQEEKNVIFTSLIWKEWDQEKKNIPEKKWKHYEKEINKELDIVTETGMADYFLLDYEVVNKGKELGGFITMTGRGSAPSFYLSKLLGFTTIDRIGATVKLFPERFITKERILEAGTIPDIDFNLGNPHVFAEAQTKVLGDNHSYPMLAYGTLKPKAAWKLFARAKDIDFETANEVSTQIDKYEMALKHAETEEDKENINILDFIESEFQDTYEGSKKYLGIVSDWKIHPCAYIMYQGNIREEIGIVKIKDNVCSCMDGLWAEEYKFLKNDLLKVSSVDLIYRVYKKLNREPHSLIELIELCKDDKKVWDVYKNAWTMGINQVEQNSTSGRVASYAPKNISELSAFVAAVRPGFKSNYKQFEARESFSYGIPSLDNLIQTEEFPQSYLLYQENAMQVLAYAGIPISETYEIVKNIAKKRAEKVFKYKEKFIKGMTKKVIQEEKREEKEAEKIAKQTWQIIEDSSRYSFNASHSYSMAGDSLYGAYLKSNHTFEFYEAFLQMLEEDGDKDRLSLAKNEAQEAFSIVFPPYKFGQDNRKILSNKNKNEITSSLASIKGFSNSIGENMYELGQHQFADFVDMLVYAEENNLNTSKISELIRINYFDCFGHNKMLLLLYEEFTKGKSRYSKTHSEATKAKRIEGLKEYAKTLPNERISVSEQLIYENDILGYVQATYPINRRYVFVKSLDTKFAPRAECYCLANGKTNSLKIQKKIYEHDMFGGGEILYVKKFEEKPAVKFVDGKYVEDETQKAWWIQSFIIIPPEEFDKIVGDAHEKN